MHSQEVNWLDRTWGDQIPLGLPSKVLTVQPLSLYPGLLPRRLCFWSTAHYLQIQLQSEVVNFDCMLSSKVVLPSLSLFFPKAFPFFLPESKSLQTFPGQGWPVICLLVKTLQNSRPSYSAQFWLRFFVMEKWCESDGTREQTVNRSGAFWNYLSGNFSVLFSYILLLYDNPCTLDLQCYLSFTFARKLRLVLPEKISCQTHGETDRHSRYRGQNPELKIS